VQRRVRKKEHFSKTYKKSSEGALAIPWAGDEQLTHREKERKTERKKERKKEKEQKEA
jgi:hypothetical protein